MDHTMIERYGGPPAWRRPVTIVAVVVLALAGLGWLGWAVYGESTPKVQSQLVTFQVRDEHAVTARVDVSLASGATGATCTVQALAADHSVVGELRFRPTDGPNQVTVRTERIATAVDLAGCVAKGQNRPR
jgi:hypothetical protein